MEERTKKASIENIYEDMTTLKLRQHKLIMKKKELDKKFEINRLPHSDNLRQMTHWDVVLMQVKFLSLDMFEERKWKKGVYHILSNQIATKLKKNNRKKKFDELYKKCMCLYLSINVNNTLTDISLGKENKNMSDKLNSYIKSISNVEDFNNQLTKWKESLLKIKLKLQKKFGEKNLNKAKNVFQVIELMENMISIQEENLRRIHAIKEQRERKVQEMLDNKSLNASSANDVSDFIADIDFEMSRNEMFNQADDHLLYVQSNINNLDFNDISRELNDVMEQIVNEININDFNESDIFLNPNVNISNKLSYDSSKTESPVPSTKLSETEIVTHINPKQLFYDGFTSNSSFVKSPEELKSYLEKLFKIENEKMEILPSYDYSEILKKQVDVNKDADEFTKIYFKVFPAVFFSDKFVLDRDILESEIDTYKTKYDRIIKDSEQNKLFNFKFNNFTMIQKLILVWGLCTYGNNLQILTEIINIFTFSKSISYDNEEIFIQLDKLLNEFNVDLLASNFDALGRNNRLSTHYIFNLDPPMLNSTQCSFFYNKKMLDFVKDKTKSINNEDINLCYPNGNDYSNSQTIYKKGGNSSQLLSKINLIVNIPIFKSNDIRQFIYKCLKADIKRICNRVESLFENSQSNFNSYDFLTMARKKENVMKGTRDRKLISGNGVGNGTIATSFTVTPVVTNINKNEVLQSLLNYRNDFSIGGLSDKSLDSTRTSSRQDPLEGVSFYSQQSIQREWENLRSPWYQNNTQYKPKFRKPFKPQLQSQHQSSNIINPNNPGINNSFSGGQNFNMVKNLCDNRPDK